MYILLLYLYYYVCICSLQYAHEIFISLDTTYGNHRYTAHTQSAMNFHSSLHVFSSALFLLYYRKVF